MKNKSILSKVTVAAIIAVVVVIVLSIIFRQEGEGFGYWIPLIVAVLESAVVIFSNTSIKKEQEEMEERVNLPFIVITQIREWYEDDLKEDDRRFPWGGDPEPGNVHPFFLPEATLAPYDPTVNNGTRVVYLQSCFENEGVGVAKKIKFYYKSDCDTVACVPVLRRDKKTNDELYFQFVYDSATDEKEYTFIVEFETISGIKYAQTITCSIFVYDESINSVKWESSSPKRLK